MAPFDSLPSLPDISADLPAGENLEFDPDFIELERLAQGKPEQQYGTTIVPAEEPEWRAVAAAATALLDRTHDLRVMGHLAVARLHGAGIVPYAECLVQIRNELEVRWAAVHPQLDPEDDNDPTLRANALLAVAEPGRVLRFLRQVPLARSTRAGTVSWRDISVANGTIETPAGTTKLTDAIISAAFRETEVVELAAVRAAVATALDSAKGIVAAFDDNAGHGTGPDFTDLVKLLREIAHVIATNTPSGPPPDVEAAADDTVPGATTVATGAPAAVPVMSIASMGPPTNRTDALRLLDLVVDYYQRYEPSSPLPLLIARARRLADMGFMDILRDMAPDGVSQAERVAGPQDS